MTQRLNDMFILNRLFVMALFLLIGISVCHCTESEHEKILFNFELESELDRFHWKCHTLFSLSNEHATEGTKSLRLEFFPSDYPGLEPRLRTNDWHSYNAFSFDVYNTQNTDVPLAVRIDDSEDDPDYPDRYNETFYLRPGANTVLVPLDTLITSGTNRKLDLKMICKIAVFMVKPAEKVVLYFDYIRLTR
jgi:hypothetical protein